VALWCALAAGASAEIIDRVAVSVGNQAITASELRVEVRVVAFLNESQPDLSSASLRKAAERLVEQKLVRRELELSRYSLPPESEAEQMLEQLQKVRFGGNQQRFRQALERYGITEADVRRHLWWQLALLRFIDVRFRPGIQVSDQEIQQYFEEQVRPVAAVAKPNGKVTLEEYRDKIEETLTGRRVDQMMNEWLQEARKRTRIRYEEEAF
jgi:hypothetical protein